FRYRCQPLCHSLSDSDKSMWRRIWVFPNSSIASIAKDVAVGNLPLWRRSFASSASRFAFSRAAFMPSAVCFAVSGPSYWLRGFCLATAPHFKFKSRTTGRSSLSDNFHDPQRLALSYRHVEAEARTPGENDSKSRSGVRAEWIVNPHT